MCVASFVIDTRCFVCVWLSLLMFHTPRKRSGNGTGQAKRRILFNEFSNRKQSRNGKALPNTPRSRYKSLYIRARLGATAHLCKVVVLKLTGEPPSRNRHGTARPQPTRLARAPARVRASLLPPTLAIGPIHHSILYQDKDFLSCSVTYSEGTSDIRESRIGPTVRISGPFSLGLTHCPRVVDETHNRCTSTAHPGRECNSLLLFYYSQA